MSHSRSPHAEARRRFFHKHHVNLPSLVRGSTLGHFRTSNQVCKGKNVAKRLAMTCTVGVVGLRRPLLGAGLPFNMLFTYHLTICSHILYYISAFGRFYRSFCPGKNGLPLVVIAYPARLSAPKIGCDNYMLRVSAWAFAGSPRNSPIIPSPITCQPSFVLFTPPRPHVSPPLHALPLPQFPANF